MAQFLDTQAISNELMKLIKDAKEKIILVSYSFKVNPQIQERLKTKSAQGLLSEIVIVYGKTELKKAELAWIKEIQDLKIYEKSNLHAKCYLNEEKAIICSMNLYDYSQQNNIEMGILITKDDDKQAYQELMEEIVNIKVNGIRKNIQELENGIVEISSQKTAGPLIDSKISEKPKILYTDLNPTKKLIFQFLKIWRLNQSKVEKIPAFQILTDQEIINISSLKTIDKNGLFEVMPKKNAIKYCDSILAELRYLNKYTLGEVVSVWYQSDTSKYDRVKFRILGTNEEIWFDTTKELPEKGKLLAVFLNGNWFNEYMYID